MNILKELHIIRREGLRSLYPKNMTRITVGMATCGLATGADSVFKSLLEIAENNGNRFSVVPVGCVGFCQREPLVDVLMPGLSRVTFSNMNADKLRKIAEDLNKNRINSTLAEWRYDEDNFLIFNRKKRLCNGTIPDDMKSVKRYIEIPFFKKQLKIALRNCGYINPDDIKEYIARGGYYSLYKVLTEMTPQEVIEEVKKSGLRGRGGAGFPTGMKWEICRKAEGDIKYIICNADEGDPGAYMDRSILESDPHSVIEGMLIGAYAIGASQGYIYVRTEYPLAIERFTKAIEDAERYGLLGRDIFGKGFNFKVNVSQGAGAFVCGEETSLMASIEGRPPEPRLRPPFPAELGVWEKPTNINNVETWANIPVIVARGGDWFAKIGTEKSKGTKVFSLVGKINDTGLIEVPMGIKLEEILEMGGGIPEGRKFKAIQTGGPSGGCIPQKLIDLPVDYEKLAEAGSIMGSGGMIVMDERTCMVDVAKYFLEFLKDESCGKCTSCREGTKQMYEIVKRITEGKGKESDIALLENLGAVVQTASMCGLGQTAANPVLSTLKYFRDEFESHIKCKRCPAVVCKEIISSPCQYTCPIDTNASVYIALIAHGKFREAYEIIKKDNPMPTVVSRVCHHPCEMKCRAGDSGEPIKIRALKRFVVDWARNNNIENNHSKASPSGLKVAIVGSGPAGLSAGYYLALKGHCVTIFEAEDRPGGMLRVAIPEYRLPRDVLDYDIEHIKSAGVEIQTNTKVGNDITIDGIFKKGYTAIFVAVGAHSSLELGIPGEDIPGVFSSMEFLKAIHSGKKVNIGKRVSVIGGGNSAVDAARVAKRLGSEVTIIYRRTKKEMPAFREEVDNALKEGIQIHFLAAPVKISKENGKISEIECIRMELGAPDESGRRRPIPIKGSEFKIAADALITAISETPSTEFLQGEVKITRWHTLEVDEESFMSSYPGIFAGGDGIRGPSTVIEAIRDGKIAAESINCYLKAEKFQREYNITRPSIYVPPKELTDEEISELGKIDIPVLKPEQRLNNFKEVELGYSEEMAIKEAKRCLRCELETKEGWAFLEKLRSKPNG